MAQLLHGLPLRMKHTITTPRRFNPYPFQLRCSQSPSPLKSPIVNDVTQKSTPSVSPTEHRPQQPLLDLTNSLDDQGSTSSDNSILDTLSANKKENPLPPINKAALLKPEDVVEKYTRFLSISKIPTLAVRLAKESYFGKPIMALCTVRAAGKFHALPERELKELKAFMKKLCIPSLTPTQVQFEMVWKNAIESTGQACKSLRCDGNRP